MADSAVFEWVAAALERATSFDSLQARGTVRLALRKAGLEAGAVDLEGMSAVLARVMPRELTLRKIPDAEALCARLARELSGSNLAAPASGQPSPEDVFKRLFGNR
jgi:hypothetical protein